MKKLLSIILCAAMLISLVPMVFAAESSTEIVDTAHYEYVFNSGAHAITSDYRNLASGKHTIETTDTSVSSGRWGFVNVKTHSGYATNSVNTVWHFVEDNENIIPIFTRGTEYSGDRMTMAIAFELEVNKKGTYQPSLSFMKYIASPKFEVYLVKKPSSQEKVDKWHYSTAAGETFWGSICGVSANDYLGTVDFYGNYTADSDDAIYTNSEDLRLVDLDTGIYYLVLVGNGVNDSWALENHSNGNKYVRTKLHSFSLDEVIEPTTLTYVTTLDAFNTGLMHIDGSKYSTPGVLREKYLLQCNKAFSWKTWAEVDKNGNAVTEETKYKTMNLSATDPWEYFANKSTSSLRIDGSPYNGTNMTFSAGGYQSTTSGGFLALRIRIPHEGKYMMQFATGRQVETAAYPAIYFYKDDGSKEAYYAKTNSGSFVSSSTYIGHFDLSAAAAGTFADFVEVDVQSAGDYFVIFRPDPKSRVLNPKVHNATSGTATGTVSIENLVDENGNIIPWYKSESAPLYKNGLPIEKASTDADGNPTTTKVDGTYYQYLYLSGIRLVPVENKELNEKKAQYAANLTAYNDAQNVDKGENEAVAAPESAIISVSSSDVNGKAVPGAEVKGGGTYTINSDVTVSANNPAGYRFSHWAVGTAGMPVSNASEYTFTAGSSTRLTAVYAPVANEGTTTVIYYAADGAEESRISVESGSEATLPSLPAVVGGTSSKWQATDKNLYDAGDKVVVSGSVAVFVADFVPNTYTIKANGSISNANPAYGEKVTITANARENLTSGDSFNYWLDDNGNIVSFKESYSFYAYRDCEYTAVYKQFEPISKSLRKIILNKDGSQLMAEFIGFNSSDIVERGILFGSDLSNFSAKAVMKTDAKQFAVYNDTALSGVGYAILADGNVIYSK